MQILFNKENNKYLQALQYFENDPTPEESIKRVGKNYLGEDLSDYIVINIPNGTFGTPEDDCNFLESLRNSKNVQLGELSQQEENSSYPYFEGLITITPKDPPSQEEKDKEQEKADIISAIDLLENKIETPGNITDTEKGAIIFDLFHNQKKVKKTEKDIYNLKKLRM